MDHNMLTRDPTISFLVNIDCATVISVSSETGEGYIIFRFVNTSGHTVLAVEVNSISLFLQKI